MFSRSLVIPFLLAAVPVAGAAWILAPTLVDTLVEREQAGVRAPVAAAAKIPDLDALRPRQSGEQAPRFDVARIGQDGYSVFAGTAPAFSTVTVTSNGVPIASTTADHNGEWSLVSDYKFPPGDPLLGLATRLEGVPPVTGAEGRRTATSLQAAAAPQAAGVAQATAVQRSATDDPSRGMMRELEKMVEAARREPAEAHSIAVAPRAPVPVPVQFVFREATFTEQGHKAAALLLDYLRLTKPHSITLTGHADERGSDAFNLELSRERLNTIAKYLRDNGYEGNLVLIPKGRSEPYRGVDRSTLSREALYQLDRRVELEIGSLRNAGTSESRSQ